MSLLTSSTDKTKGAEPVQDLLLSNQSCYSTCSARIHHSSLQLSCNRKICSCKIYIYFLSAQTFLRAEPQGAREGRERGEANADRYSRTDPLKIREVLKISLLSILHPACVKEPAHRSQGKFK